LQFVVSEDPALNDWVTTINKYIQMFSNGVNIEQFVAELEKTLTKIFPVSTPKLLNKLVLYY